MTPEIWQQLFMEWGPWAVVALLLWRCIKRQNEREDRLAEVVQNGATAMTELRDKVKEALRQR